MFLLSASTAFAFRHSFKIEFGETRHGIFDVSIIQIKIKLVKIKTLMNYIPSDETFSSSETRNWIVQVYKFSTSISK